MFPLGSGEGGGGSVYFQKRNLKLWSGGSNYPLTKDLKGSRILGEEGFGKDMAGGGRGKGGYLANTKLKVRRGSNTSCLHSDVSDIKDRGGKIRETRHGASVRGATWEREIQKKSAEKPQGRRREETHGEEGE